MDPIKFSTEKHEHYVVIKLDEEKLASTNAPQLKREFVTLHAEGVVNLIVNLENVKYVDSSGLSALLVANRLWNNSGGLFIISSLNPHVQKLIEISKLENTLTIVAGKQEGIEMVFLQAVNAEDDDDLENEIMDEFGSLTGGKE